MARLAPLLKALAPEQWRDLGSLSGARSNNLVVFALVVFGVQPSGGAFLPGLVGLLLLVPASTDPLRRLPAERLALLPLRERDRIWLRAAGLAMNPVVWLAFGALILAGGRYRAHAWWLLLLGVGTNAALFVRGRLSGPTPRFSLFRCIPPLPGKLGGLIRKNLREGLLQLDPYLGLLLSVSGLAYRISSPRPVPEALFGLSLLVVLALSTCAQGLFAVEGRHGFERYALLPLRGWEVLLAKDLAWMTILLVLLLPLAPLPGLAAGLMALAVGHHPSVHHRAPQSPWGFASGVSLGQGLLQVVLLALGGTLVHRDSMWYLAPCLGLYLGSLALFGRRLEGE